MRVCGTSKIDKFNFCRYWSVPFSSSALGTRILPWKIARIVYVTTSLTSIYTPLVLYLLKHETLTNNTTLAIYLRLGTVFHLLLSLSYHLLVVYSLALDRYEWGGESVETRLPVETTGLSHEPARSRILCSYCLWWSHKDSYQVVRRRGTYY